MPTLPEPKLGSLLIATPAVVRALPRGARHVDRQGKYRHVDFSVLTAVGDHLDVLRPHVTQSGLYQYLTRAHATHPGWRFMYRRITAGWRVWRVA
jgi:hypothetical protein